MTRDEIQAELKRLAPWFHRIDLGNGLFTKTESVMGEPVDHPHGPWQTIQKLLPPSLAGQTLLDVGCNAGFYAFEAKRRGAKRVLGVDGQRQHVRQGLFVRKALGLDVEFRRLNVYELAPRTVGRFDITLALGLLYHLKHPILALENLYQVTKELLVIETAIMPPERTPESFLHPLGEQQMLLHALAYVENPAAAKEQVFNWFLPSVPALVALLRNTGFAEVEVVELKNERAVVVCRKGEAATQADALKNFVAELQLESGPTTCEPSAELTFRLRVENIGSAHWPMAGVAGKVNVTGEINQGDAVDEGGAFESDKGAVYLGSHLLASDEDEVDWDYGRARLPHDLGPGEAASLELHVRAPETPGRYLVEFDMVAEHVTWFEDHGSGTLRLELEVQSPKSKVQSPSGAD
jgi:tRNA (mo5U34)-methyltransferase